MSNKIAIVTGGASGIGKACAQRLAQDGFSVVINYRSKGEAAESLLAELGSNNHMLCKADLSNKQAVQDLVNTTIEQYGKIDLVVNAAGVFDEHDITSLDYDSWNKYWELNLATNLIGPVNLSFCAAQYMLKQGGGKIVNITSRGAFRGEPDAPAYGASKAGLNSASQSIAKALAPHGISVYAIAPGWIDTELIASCLEGSSGDSIRAQSPLGRIGHVSEIANLVSFLAGDQTEYLTGAIFDANGASYLRN